MRKRERERNGRREAGLGWGLVLVLSLLGACDTAPPPAIGEPLAGLSDAERARFVEGEALFNRIYDEAEGLGPLFNENQCSACHTDPRSGGTGEQFLMRAVTRDDSLGRCDALIGHGGDNIRTRATPALRALGIQKDPLPEAATHTGRFVVPFLFGLGLVEAVPEESLLARADPEDADGDGISGRPGRDADGRYARFGHKGEFASIEAFTAGALRMEMGLTSPLLPEEAWGALEPHPEADPAADPEVDRATLDGMVDFVRFLAPAPPFVPESAAARDTIATGRQLFERIGCTGCHVPRLRTGDSDVAALANRDFEMYSDFLLHDLGRVLSDVCGIAAMPGELRTAPLAGLRHRGMYLHDGRALSIEEAIRFHDGEAAMARERFEDLPVQLQQALLRFLSVL